MSLGVNSLCQHYPTFLDHSQERVASRMYVVTFGTCKNPTSSSHLRVSKLNYTYKTYFAMSDDGNEGVTAA